ncbi:MAG TPA: hypothetical protein VMU53_07950 [Candidatus Sulfotelmatobacter sp.]|nr:hypothetical protein [Candidatus Sulfotelmatobacter sp.]
MRKANFVLALVVALGAGILALAQSTQQTAPKVKVGTQLTAKAAAPTPGPTAKNTGQKTSVGKGATVVKASAPSSSWTEELDVDDDGSVETSDYLYDAQRGVLYTYREDDFSCPNGNPESGSILMALYAKGNKTNKPVGSGWYVVNLNAGQCAAKKAGTFGCKFDANGNATECGAARINDATGEIDVIVAKS